MGMQGELLELLKGADMDGNQTLDYREFLAATMEKVRGAVSCNQVKVKGTIPCNQVKVKGTATDHERQPQCQRGQYFLERGLDKRQMPL